MQTPETRGGLLNLVESSGYFLLLRFLEILWKIFKCKICRKPLRMYKTKNRMWFLCSVRDESVETPKDL